MTVENYEFKGQPVQLGGAKRKNGHKANCSCHICENMKNKAKRGGYEEDAKKKQIKLMGGSKKKNGHKPDCDCPICKNMKNAKKGGYTDEQSQGEYNEKDKIDSGITGGKKSNGHKATCGCPICKNMKKKGKKGGEEPVNVDSMPVTPDNIPAKKEIEANPDEYDNLDTLPNKVGGTRKRRGNGHKANCNCPICKNMKKKTRRNRKRSQRRR
jgi:hypothetical protein